MKLLEMGILALAVLFFSEVIAGNVRNEIEIKEITWADSSHFNIGLYLTNEDTLGGIQIPITFASHPLDIKADSIDFAGGRCEDFDLKVAHIDTSKAMLYIMLIGGANMDSSYSLLEPGSGKIASIFFRLDFGESVLHGKEKIKIKRRNLNRGGIDWSLKCWSPNAIEYECDFKNIVIDLQ